MEARLLQQGLSSGPFVEALQGLVALAQARHEDALMLPTIAATSGLEQGLTALNDRLPEDGKGLSASYKHLMEEVLPTLAPGQAATRYFGFITGGVLPVALVADWFVSLLDANVQVQLPRETLSTLIEAHTVAMLCDLLSLPRERWTGTITTGATSSNILGLACAREQVLQRAMQARGAGDDWSLAENGYDEHTALVNVFVAQPHASIKKAAAIVGIGRRRVKDLGRRNTADNLVASVDFDLDELKAHLVLAEERKEGAVVVVGMGEVNTGALSAQVPAIKALCNKHGAWLHIDAAFSAFVCLLGSFGWISRHLDMADSITSDGHKQLNVPYDCGLFFVRKTEQPHSNHAAHLEHEYSILEDVLGPGRGSAAPSYLLSSSAGSNSDAKTSSSDDRDSLLEQRQRYLSRLPSPLFRNIENSRRFRALPLYLTMMCHGRSGIKEIVRRDVNFARAVEAWMRDESGGASFYDVLTPPCKQSEVPTSEELGRFINTEPQPWTGAWTTTVLLFAPRADCPIEAFREPTTGASRLIEAIKATRKIYVSPTTWAGRSAVRLAVSNWRTGLEGARGGPKEGQVVDRIEDSEDYSVTIDTLREVMAVRAM